MSPRRIPGRLALLALAILSACTATPAPTPGESAGAEPDESASASTSSGGASSAPSQPPLVADAWEVLPDAPFARLEMAVAAHDGRIWLAGGLSPLGEALIDVDILDPSTGEWSEGPSLPSPLHHAALVSDGDRLVLLGGYQGSDFNRPTDLVLVLADGAESWEPVAPLPEARAAGAAAWDGDRVVYAGGVGPQGVAADVHALESDAWVRIGSMAQVREHLAATSDGDGRVWLLGGRVGSLSTNLGQVELVEGDAISDIGDLPTPRGGVAAFHDQSLGACLTGGEATDRAFTTVECIDAGGAVETLPELNEPHHGHGAAVVDGIAYVVLGGPEPTLSAASTLETLALGD
jgi:non-specific serine/threonine protein kinase